MDPVQMQAVVNKRPEPFWYLVAYLGVVAGAVIGWALFKWTDPKPFKPAPEVSVFALLYVFAQVIERLLEPVSSFFDAQTGEKSGSPDERARANKAITLFALASIVAMALSGWFGVFLLNLIGADNVPRIVDIAVTGLAIGGGTKPLHDLITNIQKSKEAKQQQLA